MSGETQPQVSVVIPSYNRAGLIAAAVASCLAQDDVSGIEVIVVDDCSEDDTAAVVQSIGDERVHYLRLAQNQGGAAARNAGIAAASGKYLALLDSDDAWHPLKLSKQLALIEAAAQPGRLVVHTQVRVCRGDSVEIQPRRAKADGERIADYLFVSDGHMQTSSLLMETELAQRTLFDPSLRKHQDYDFCLRLEQQGAVFALAEETLVDWHHDERPDRITRRYGTAASEHFLQTRRAELGRAAATAFWVKMIFLRQLRVTPFKATGQFMSVLVSGGLPIGWYWRWFIAGAGKRFGGAGRNTAAGGGS